MKLRRWLQNRYIFEGFSAPYKRKIRFNGVLTGYNPTSRKSENSPSPAGPARPNPPGATKAGNCGSIFDDTEVRVRAEAFLRKGSAHIDRSGFTEGQKSFGEPSLRIASTNEQ